MTLCRCVFYIQRKKIFLAPESSSFCCLKPARIQSVYRIRLKKRQYFSCPASVRNSTRIGRQRLKRPRDFPARFYIQLSRLFGRLGKTNKRYRSLAKRFSKLSQEMPKNPNRLKKYFPEF